MIESLWPPFVERLGDMLADLESAGINCLRVCECRRDRGRQEELYAMGRTAQGDVVTRSDGQREMSTHQFGMAATILPFDDKDCLSFSDGDSLLDALRGAASRNGLEMTQPWVAQWPAGDRDAYLLAYQEAPV